METHLSNLAPVLSDPGELYRHGNGRRPYFANSFPSHFKSHALKFNK